MKRKAINPTVITFASNLKEWVTLKRSKQTILHLSIWLHPRTILEMKHQGWLRWAMSGTQLIIKHWRITKVNQTWLRLEVSRQRKCEGKKEIFQTFWYRRFTVLPYHQSNKTSKAVDKWRYQSAKKKVQSKSKSKSIKRTENCESRPKSTITSKIIQKKNQSFRWKNDTARGSQDLTTKSASRYKPMNYMTTQPSRVAGVRYEKLIIFIYLEIKHHWKDQNIAWGITIDFQKKGKKAKDTFELVNFDVENKISVIY